MAKWIAELTFTANVEIEAPDEDAAYAEACGALDGKSVYDDDMVEEVHDEAYWAGVSQSDPPLLKRKAYEMSDKDFTGEVVRVSMAKE
jgi:hypothetical protein